MATATAYSLRLSPPPPLAAASRRGHHSALLPQLRSRVAARVAASWAPEYGSDGSDDGFRGWWLPEQPAEQGREVGIVFSLPRKALAVGLGASSAIALAGITWHFPSSRKCLQQFVCVPLHYVHEKLSTLDSKESPKEDACDREMNTVDDSRTPLDERVHAKHDDLYRNHMPSSGVRVSFRFPVDPMHEEAFSILKKLKIIEKDATSSEFCTRREFARWFVILQSKLERKRMHRILPDIISSGLVRSAFDDVVADDPDFLYIQSLGETGIVPSKLSNFLGTPTSVSSSGNGNSNFLPDSDLSRFDLVNWKVLVEHPFASELDQKMLSKNVHIMDLNDWPDVPSSMLVDLMDREQSIISRVFGNTRRLQPHKPVTKAQAAAALISGRMEEGKMQKEQNREFEVDKQLQFALEELSNEQTDREKELAVLLREWTALEHQNQELIKLRSEIDGMYDRLAMESLEVMADEQNLEKLSSDVSRKHQAVSEAKSNLEAEKEALTMLRSWVEEEAARVHERAELLEKAVRRWRIPAD
ncbi:hypothetical protein GUJ93_ZPchr0012g21174 [Zizania palustris]|uniref:SLH domain-containing protein n=1 Tax=Zizania palustris TaxID=103762 RepID=A0A8J6BVU5_ZIZPA|nr:hypothetical protein GUJ93_ZPchr0012g21174 [Zizania palustris]